MKFCSLRDNSVFAADVLDDRGGVGASKSEGIGKGFAGGIGGEEAGAKGVAGTGRIFDFDIFVDADAVDFFAVGGDSALMAVGNNDIRYVVFELCDELGEQGAVDDFLRFVFIDEQDVDVREQAKEFAGVLELEFARIEHDLRAEGFCLGEKLVEAVHVAVESGDVEPIWVDGLEVFRVNGVKTRARAAAGENRALATWGEHDNGITGWSILGISNVARINTFVVEGIEDGLASRIFGDAAHKNGFVAAARKSSSSVCGAAAGAEFDFVDVDLGAELQLIEKAVAIGAKIVMIDEINVLKGRADANDTSH